MKASSKIFLVCGFCVSFGIYTSGIQEANWSIIDVGQQRSYSTQARVLSNAGLNNAMFNMREPSWFDNNKNLATGIYTSSKISFGGDEVWYTIDKIGLPSHEACVTVTAKFNNVYTRQRTIIKKSADPTDIGYRASSLKDGSGNLYNAWKVKQTYYFPYMLTESERSPNSLTPRL
jgi:hypothetical protein